MTALDFIDKPLTIKTPPDFTVVSTFAGCGGSSTGYVWAGGKVLLAVEWDKNAVDTYRLNYPDTPIYHGDIAKLSVEECLRLTGLQPGQLDIFDGSPPCQGFSTAGKRNFEDDRNQLFREYVRLLKGLQPKVFVMENVSGMVKGKMKLIFAEIMRELKAAGYSVKCQLMNTMYFGVPQSRQRVIFIGVRNDLGITPTHPKPQTYPAGVVLQDDVTPDLFVSEKRFALLQAHKARHIAKGNGFAWQEIKPGKPSTAIAKNMGMPGAGTKLIRDTQGYRYPTNLEVKQIGGYPYHYQFTDRDSMIERIGNSVPPRFMMAVAEHIRDQLLSKIRMGQSPELDTTR